MERVVLHELVETGQARPEQLKEMAVVVCRTALRALGTSLIWGSVITGGRWLFGDDISWWSALATYGAAWAIRFGLSIEGDIDDHLDGLRSEKVATTYAPLQPEPIVAPPSPIVVRPLGNDPYILDGEARTALPDGRQTRVGLNPETLAVVLGEIVEKHDGFWSRKRLMGIKVNGQRITRKLYEEFTDALCRARFLQERPTGGFQVPPQVQSFDDLRVYFPNLPGLGGQAGRLEGREGGPPKLSRPSGGRALTLAERRKQRWLECGCDVRLYRGEL